MAGLRSMRFLPGALVALLLASATRADNIINFDFYPSGAQDCLYQAAATSQCESSTVSATNSCLCRNGGDFVTNAAACLGRSDPNDLSVVYDTMSDACDASQTALTISKAAFMAAANSATSTSSTASATSTTTTSSSSTSSTSSGTATATSPAGTSAADNQQGGQKSSGLSTAAMAGVIVGAVAGGVLLAALGFFLFRRRRKLGEESHPMLPQQAYAGAIPGPRESSAYYSSPPGTGGWPKKDWGPSPDMRSSGFNWESPAHLSYPGGPLAPSPPLPPQELDSVQHFPTGSAQAPAEISGTPIATAAPASMQFQPYNPGQRQPGVG